ncbi:MAG: GNAT family N-acetyltransferase [Gaiellaceae bacterium]
MAIEVRVCAPDEVRGALDPIWHYFGLRATAEDVERFAPILPAERVHAAFEDGSIIGGAGAYLFETTVPGGAAVPTAGVMAVGVLPTHRRRGALSELMRRQLADAHERGEALATLYASEGGIYGRYGYGLASLAGDIDLPKEHALLRDPDPIGQARILDTEEEALDVLPAIYDRVRLETVGMFTRTPDWWRARRFFEPPGQRDGRQVRVVVEIEGRAEAYALYRLDFAAQHMVSETALEVVEAVGTSPRALAAIWRYLLAVDWVARIRAHWLPLDHPLFLWLREPRRMGFSVVEAVWVRLVDVGAALSARGYKGDGAIVFDVRDEFCPWNQARWRLAEGTAERTTAEADIRLTAGELGSVYLGGFTFDQLLRAERLEELSKDAVARADELFRTKRQPWCPELF